MSEKKNPVTELMEVGSVIGASAEMKEQTNSDHVQQETFEIPAVVKMGISKGFAGIRYWYEVQVNGEKVSQGDWDKDDVKWLPSAIQNMISDIDASNRTAQRRYR